MQQQLSPELSRELGRLFSTPYGTYLRLDRELDLTKMFVSLAQREGSDILQWKSGPRSELLMMELSNYLEGFDGLSLEDVPGLLREGKFDRAKAEELAPLYGIELREPEEGEDFEEEE